MPEHIDTKSDCDELIREVMDFRMIYLLDRATHCTHCSLFVPLH